MKPLLRFLGLSLIAGSAWVLFSACPTLKTKGEWSTDTSELKSSLPDRKPHTFQCKYRGGCKAYNPAWGGWVTFRKGDIIDSAEPFFLPRRDGWYCIHCQPTHRPGVGPRE